MSNACVDDLLVSDEDLCPLARGRLHADKSHPLARHFLQLAVGQQEARGAQKALLKPAASLKTDTVIIFLKS